MSRVINTFKIIRNNWKKSVFGAVAFSYGVKYSIDTYEINQIMKKYCEEAATYGNQPLPTYLRPQQITVILNPASNKRKAKHLFEKYCEPLLHLAGFAVTIIQTQSENQARNLVSNLNTNVSAIIVAGGDGTVSDVVTGVMRKYKQNTEIIKQYPIGILPLGQTNRLANSLFFGYNDLIEVRKLIDATMAVIRGKTKLADVMEVELLEKDVEHPQESIYAISSVEWGAWKDAYIRMDKYWYWGSLRKYVTFVFNGLKNDLNWNCNGILRYSDPCNGCSKCYRRENTFISEKRWWHAFVPKVKNFSTGETNKDYSKVINNNCGVFREVPISTTELSIITQNVEEANESIPSIKIELGPKNINYIDFITEGWQRLKGNKTLVNETFKAKDIEIHPLDTNNSMKKERTFYIDNEEFELKPVKFKLLSKIITIFCSENHNNN